MRRTPDPDQDRPGHCEGGRSGIRGGGAADLWSLGVTFFCALEGYSPFLQRGSRPEATLIAVLSADLPGLTRPGKLADLVPRLLQKDPSARPTANEVAPILQSVLDEPVTQQTVPRSRSRT